MKEAKHLLIVGSPRPGGFAAATGHAARQAGLSVTFGQGHNVYRRMLRPGTEGSSEADKALVARLQDECRFHPLNVSEPEKMATSLEAIVNDGGKVDYMVYTPAFASNQIIQGGNAPESDWEMARDVTVRGFYRLYEAGQQLGVWEPNACFLFYGFLAPSGILERYPLRGLKRELGESARKLALAAQDGHRFNAIVTGPLFTTSGSALPALAEAATYWQQEAPLSWPSREDQSAALEAVGKATVALLQLPFVTGEVIHVDGGLHLKYLPEA